MSRSVVTGNSLQINPQATYNWTEVFLRMVAILPLTRVDIVAIFSLIELAPLRRGFLFRIAIIHRTSPGRAVNPGLAETEGRGQEVVRGRPASKQPSQTRCTDRWLSVTAIKIIWGRPSAGEPKNIAPAT